jgi:hypothetical protein
MPQLAPTPHPDGLLESSPPPHPPPHQPWLDFANSSKCATHIWKWGPDLSLNIHVSLTSLLGNFLLTLQPHLTFFSRDISLTPFHSRLSPADCALTYFAFHFSLTLISFTPLLNVYSMSVSHLTIVNFTATAQKFHSLSCFFILPIISGGQIIFIK